MAKKKSGEKQLEEAGHKVTDPDVVAKTDELATLMTAFDNLGVSIVEEQWRALSDNERTVAASWANDVRIGKDRPCPECLFPFASQKLIADAKKHVKRQEAARKILVRCRFLKPAAVLPNGDEGQDAIKWGVVIPDSDMSRASLAEDFFVGKRLHIAMSLRSVDKWDGFPEMDDNLPDIVECEADVKGFARTMKGYKFSFQMSTDLIDDNTAYRHYAKNEGSIRLTLIGPIPKKEKAEESTAASVAKSRPLPGQKSLLDHPVKTGAVSKVAVDKKGLFVAPDEYMVPSHVKDCATIITIGELDGVFYPSAETTFVDDAGEQQQDDWGQPKTGKDGCASLTLAVQKMLGTVIQFQIDNGANAACVDDLRNHLKDLEGGKEPIPVPE